MADPFVLTEDLLLFFQAFGAVLMGQSVRALYAVLALPE
jgi:hypothetical protein